jgi:hypothetical protein
MAFPELAYEATMQLPLQWKLDKCVPYQMRLCSGHDQSVVAVGRLYTQPVTPAICYTTGKAGNVYLGTHRSSCVVPVRCVSQNSCPRA